MEKRLDAHRRLACCVWLFLCVSVPPVFARSPGIGYFPRMALLIPHILLLGVMLCYYPDPGAQPVPINVGEGTADWQANIQAIQNLMGAL